MIDSILKNARILIVDDQQANIDIITDLLDMLGYTSFKTTSDPRLVVDLYNEFNPDLILLDLMMPHLSGFQVMDQLENVIPEDTYLPILVLTANVSNEAKERALAGGAKDFLTKPFDLVEVSLRIKNLLETRYLHIQLQNQNQILEGKVKERTAELETTIIDLEIAKNKAEASDRLKTAFMNNISHEIRTPLNGILGFAPFIIQPDITQEEKKEFLKILNLSSKRLMNTVNDYMDISLIVSGNMEVHPQPTSINSMLTNVFEYFQESCSKKNLELKMQIPDKADHIILHTDEEMLRKTITKLVDNAIKFTKEGSVTLGFKQINNEIEIFVKDTGKGIEKNSQELIYKYFMQENVSNTRSYEGSGLGLTIAKGIMQLLGGKIQLESDENQGTSVFITLPVEESPLSKNVKIDSAEDIDKKLKKILIAEDDENSKMYLKVITNSLCKEVLIVENGIEAVEVCRKNPDIDLVLMDIQMPGMSGYDATREIRKFNKRMVIIAQTAFAIAGDREKAIEAGCNDYISKPISEDVLMTLIQKYFKN